MNTRENDNSSTGHINIGNGDFDLYIDDLYPSEQPNQSNQAQPVQPKVTVDQAAQAGQYTIEQGLSEINALEKMATTSVRQDYVNAAVLSQQFVVNLLSGAPQDNTLVPKICRSISYSATPLAVHAFEHDAKIVFAVTVAAISIANLAEIERRRANAGPAATLNPGQALTDTAKGFAPRVGYIFAGLVVAMKDLPTVQFVNNEVVDGFVNGAASAALPITPVFESNNALTSFFPVVGGYLGKLASIFTTPDKGVLIINTGLTKAMADIFNAVVSQMVSPTIDALSRLMGAAPGPQSTSQEIGTAIVKSAATRVVANEVVVAGMTMFASGGSSTAALTTALTALPSFPVVTSVVGGTLAVRAIQVGPAQAADEIKTIASNVVDGAVNNQVVQGARNVVAVTVNEAANVAQNTAGFFFNHPYLTAGLVTTLGVGALAYSAANNTSANDALTHSIINSFGLGE